MARPKVVIIGAGFAGLECAKRLAHEPVDVLLLDQNNYHLFTPLLYQVASSLLNPSDIAYPVRAVFRGVPNVRFRLGRVASIDLPGHRVVLDDGEAVPYDYVVIAAGSHTNFFGLRAVEATAEGLKDLPEAIRLRSHVISAFEAAARETDPGAREAWLRFIVVGGGPTGVEYAGAVSELIHLVVAREYPELDVRAARVILVEALERVLPAFAPRLGEDAKVRLERLGVDVRLNTRVRDVTDGKVLLSTGEVLPSRTLVWAAGVRASELAAPLGIPLTAQGRIVVDEHLCLPGRRNAFAVGDIASVTQGELELPMIAQPAIQGGAHVARTILRLETNEPLRPFRYRDKGIMATIGRHAAVAQIGKLAFKGVLGWYAWLALHLYFIIGFRNRAAVLLSWAWNYVFYDRPIRLITQGRDWRLDG
jgi:NADH dehydrogenase